MPKKLPENLADFAALAGVSAESLSQKIIELNQAGITIKDPHEKLSNQTKKQLLDFFRNKTAGDAGIKQTRVSKLSNNQDTSRSVKITTLSRKVTVEPVSNITLQQETVSEKETPTHTEDEKSKAPIEHTVTIDADESLSELLEKQKGKNASTKKKAKLAPIAKSNKRIIKDKYAELPEEELEEEVQAVTPPTVTVKKQQRQEGIKQTFKRPTHRTIRDIWIPQQLTVFELAKKMSIKDTEVIVCLKKMGFAFEYHDEQLDQDTAALVVEEMGHRPRLVVYNAEEVALRESLEKQMGESHKRPPIVTIMGHVDHGKTSLLDAIRRTKVTAGEAGGITQHIGAYHVTLPKGVVTFLDTPGHAAFTAMRARGARLTDIVALVVAADDGPMPQTIEAIEHAQAANVPIVVVINKIDKPNANVEAIQQSLSQYNLISEDWGGETLFVSVSAKTGDGIDGLLDALLLQAEIGELAAPAQGPAQGIIVESRLDKGQGPVATMIVQKGLLKKGDILLAGTSFGRIKALHDEQGKTISAAGPSIPVEVLGLSAPPEAGEEVIVVPNERKAREIAQARATAANAAQLETTAQRSLNILTDPFKAQAQKTIHVIIKADVQGSAEALKESLLKLSTDTVAIKILMTGVGTIAESDVNLAIASKAIIFGFNVKADNIAKRLIQKDKVVVYYYSIIYELLDEAKKIVYGLIEPQTKETVLGKASIRELFKASKTSVIAGCTVTEGTIYSHHPVKIIRNKTVVYQGKLHSLRRFKDNVKEVNIGTECGIGIKNHKDLQVGDIIESYESTLVVQRP